MIPADRGRNAAGACPTPRPDGGAPGRCGPRREPFVPAVARRLPSPGSLLLAERKCIGCDAGRGVRLLDCVECGCCSDVLGKGWVALRCDVPDRDEPADCEPAVAIYLAQHASSATGQKPQPADRGAWNPREPSASRWFGRESCRRSRLAHTSTSAAAFPSSARRSSCGERMALRPERRCRGTSRASIRLPTRPLP
jgi:hypothetical protein